MKTAVVGCLLGALALAPPIARAQPEPPADTLDLREALAVGPLLSADPSTLEQALPIDSTRRQAPLHLGQLLQLRTPVFIKGYGSNGIATASLRGTGASHTKVYWNQLDLGSPSLGLADLSTFPLAAVSEARLQYGVASLNAGSGALGGNLLLRTSLSARGKTKLQGSAAGGSFGQWQGQWEASYGPSRFRFKTSVYAQGQQNNYPYPDITQRGAPQRRMRFARNVQQGMVQSFQGRLGDQDYLEAHIWYHRLRRQLPPTLLSNPERYDSLTDERLAAVATWHHQAAGGSWHLTSGLVNARNDFVNGSDSSSSNNHFQSWQNRWTWKAQPHKHWRYRLGLEYQLVQARSPAFATPARQQRIAAVAHTSWQALPWLSLQSTLRWEHIQQRLRPLVGSVGTVLHLAEGHQLKLNLGTNYRFPSLNDRHWQPGGNPDLRAESSVNYEINYRWASKDTAAAFQWNLQITGYQNVVDNWIQWAPQNGFWQPRNLKKVRNRGLEWRPEGSLSSGAFSWKGWLSYRLVFSQVEAAYNQEIPLGRQLSYLPRHKGSAGTALGWKHWRLSYLHQYTGPYATVADGSTFMPAYGTGTLSLGLRDLLPRQEAGLSAYLRIGNVWDWPYQIMPYRPEPGRHWSLKITYTPRL